MCWPAAGVLTTFSTRQTIKSSLIGIVFFLTRAITLGLSQNARKAHLLMCKLRRTLVKQISRQKLRERLRRNQNRAQTANNRAAACGTRRCEGALIYKNDHGGQISKESGGIYWPLHKVRGLPKRRAKLKMVGTPHIGLDHSWLFNKKMPALLLNAGSRPYVTYWKMAFGELIYSDHLMLFADLHSLRPKTTERVRVAEIESFASSNDNCYRAQFDQSRVCLGDTRRWFTDNISTVWFSFMTLLALQKNKATRRNITHVKPMHYTGANRSAPDIR